MCSHQRVVGRTGVITLKEPRVDVSPAIRDFAGKLATRYRPRRIVLFGSCARGAARPDSDVDLFVELASCRHPLSSA